MPNANYIFVKTCWERPNANSRSKKVELKRRVRPLGGQSYNGKSLDVTLNFACSRSIREEFPVGTIFGFRSFNFSDQKTHYRVNGNQLTVVDTEEPQTSMDNAYQELHPYMVNEERALKLADILGDEDIPLI